jgi:putative iron-dependent peroxidase
VIDGDDLPPSAHITVNTIANSDGSETKIQRHNVSFGDAAGPHGTYFVGYARGAQVLERMLQRMFIGEPVGNYDRILDFSTPLTGALYFVPSVAILRSLPSLAR